MDQGHDEFEQEVVGYLRGSGWIVPPSITYHDVFEPHVARALSARFDPTSLSIRGQADRVAFLLGAEQSVRVEIKTVGRQHENLAVELFAFVEHVARACMGGQCVYAVRHASGREYGFRVDVDVADAVDAVLVPYRWTDAEMASLIQRTSSWLRPNVRYVRTPSPTQGSGDPFVLIPGDRLAEFRHWQSPFLDFKTTAKGLWHATN